MHYFVSNDLHMMVEDKEGYFVLFFELVFSERRAKASDRNFVSLQSKHLKAMKRALVRERALLRKVGCWSPNFS